MFIHLDRSSHVPIYLQIKESVRSLIVQGTLRPGERLPSTRQMADKLGIPKKKSGRFTDLRGLAAAEQAAELQINVIDSAQLRSGTGQPLSI